MYFIIITILVLAIILGLWAVGAYNNLVRLKALVSEAWSGIDVQLKRRYDLIPNLVETVKGYADHEKHTFETVTRMRNAAMNAHTVAEKSDAEKGLSNALKTLFAVAENYPELRANTNFMDLQKQLAGIEEQLQLARRYYNGATRNYNIAVHTFPSALVARFGHFYTQPYFEVESPLERSTPRVKF